MSSALERILSNAFPDDPDWCRHSMVERSTWRCADCGRPVREAMRRRMETAPTAAPPGHVWVLSEGPGSAYEEDYAGGAVVGVFSDRARIAHVLVRRSIADAAYLRDRLSLLTWYQSAYNHDFFEAWGTDPHGAEVSYKLTLEGIDQP